MGHDTNEVRHLDLIRFEHAAGTAFGCIEEEDRSAAPRILAPTAFAVATFATAVAATITYLI
jgi:hypothetical protein